MLLRDGVKRGKHVLIAEGLDCAGHRMVEAFAGRGGTVAFLYREQSHQGLGLARKTGALNIKCNLSSTKSLESAADVVREFFESRLDTLICNVPFDKEIPKAAETVGSREENVVTTATGDLWNEARASLRWNQDKINAYLDQMLPLLEENGSLVLILPAESQDMSEGSRIALRILHHGLEGVVEATGQALGKRGIRVNGIALNSSRNNEDSIASLVQFLASGASAGITGQIIEL